MKETLFGQISFINFTIKDEACRSYNLAQFFIELGKRFVIISYSFLTFVTHVKETKTQLTEFCPVQLMKWKNDLSIKEKKRKKCTKKKRLTNVISPNNPIFVLYVLHNELAQLHDVTGQKRDGNI